LQTKEEEEEDKTPNLSSSSRPKPPDKTVPDQYDSSAVITGQSSQGGARKKRPGLSDSLVPGKKAMKFFDKVYENK
jgi:hypothetical protein